jgi:hypothetical protein
MQQGYCGPGIQRIARSVGLPRGSFSSVKWATPIIFVRRPYTTQSTGIEINRESIAHRQEEGGFRNDQTAMASPMFTIWQSALLRMKIKCSVHALTPILEFSYTVTSKPDFLFAQH